MDHYAHVPEFSLTIEEGGKPGQQFVFHQHKVALGRIAENDLVLYDTAVSRRHLIIQFQLDHFVCEDLQSSNGTLLNGQRIHQPSTLSENDKIEIGSVSFVFSTVIEETNDPTEIELPNEQEHKSNVDQGGLVRAKWDTRFPHPLPPEGDTRTFSTEQVPPPYPQSQQYLAGISSYDNAYPLPVSREFQFKDHHNPQPFIGQSRDFEYPMTPPPQGYPYSSNALHQMRSNQQEQRKHELKERKLIQRLSIWSFVFLVTGIVLIFLPLESSLVSFREDHLQNSILISPTIHTQVFGDNDYSHQTNTQMSSQVTFQFFHRNSRMALSFRVISHEDPIELFLNGQSILTIKSTPKSWIYQHIRFPASLLNTFELNQLIFRRKNPQLQRKWGLTHIALHEKIYPTQDPLKAENLCKKGDHLYDEREKSPENRYKSLKLFLQCQDYLARSKPVPSLYRDAHFMISQIEKELDSIFSKMLHEVKEIQQLKEQKKVYERYLTYFVDQQDHRHQRILQYQKKLQ